MTTQNPNAMYADLHERNIVIEPTEKTRLLYGLRHLLGAVERLQALDYWREAYWVQLFRAAGLRKGHAYTAAELRQIAQPGDETPRFMGQLAHLVERGAFRRGFTLSCEICGLTRWYSLAAAGATPLRCQGCRQPLAIPLEQPFAYQPNPLLCDALKNGVITEILVLLWAQEHWGHVEYQANVMLQSGSTSAEVDLLLHLPSRGWLLLEAKDDFNPAQSPGTIHEQMQNLSSFARLLDARMGFATLHAGALPHALETFFTTQKVLVLRTAALLR